MEIKFLLLLISGCQVLIGICMVLGSYSNWMVSNEVKKHYDKCEDYKNNPDNTKPEST